jgi:inner membrane protein
MINISLFTHFKQQMVDCASFFTSSDAQIMGFLWIIVGIALIIFELGTPGLFFFLSFSVGCFLTAILAFLNFSLVVQAFCFLITSSVTIVLMKNYFTRKNHSKLKTNSDALIHQEGMVVVVIEPHKPGRVKVKGDDWLAVVDKPVSLKVGTIVTIVRVEGNKLVVR